MTGLSPPDVNPKKHWKKFQLPFSIGSGRSFIPQQGGAPSLRMDFYQSTKDLSLEGFVWFGKGIEGPPGHVHGGVSAYVLDEAMGSAAWLQNMPCVAKNIQFELKRKTPIGVDFEIKAWIKKVNNSTLTIHSKIFDDHGDYTFGVGEFHWFTRQKLESFLEQSQFSLDLDALKYPE